MKKFDELRQEGYSAKTGGHEWGTDKGTAFAKKTTPGEVEEYKVPKNYAAMMQKKRKKAGTSEFGSHPDKKKEVRKEEVDLEENRAARAQSSAANKMYGRTSDPIDKKPASGAKKTMSKADIFKALDKKYGDPKKKTGIYAKEEVEQIDEIHDRYMRAHGKKASGRGKWMFTTKRMGDVDHKDMYHHKGNDTVSVAAKAAQKHFGTKNVYVMEEVELDEGRAQDMQQKVKDKIASKFHNMYDFKKVKDSQTMYNMLSMAKRRNHLKEGVELDEKKLTPAELKKREEIAKAIEKDQPDMPMDKKMAIATAQAKKAVEAKMYDSGWRKTTGPKKDKFGNTIKDKNRPKNLAKQGMAAVKKEDVELKTFSAIREATGKVVFKGKMQKVPVEIHKTSKGYVAMVDGDELDTYKSEKDAKKGIEVAIKELT